MSDDEEKAALRKVYRTYWYTQMLLRFNEAIALDHVQPMRVLDVPKEESDMSIDDCTAEELAEYERHNMAKVTAKLVWSSVAVLVGLPLAVLTAFQVMRIAHLF